MASKKSSSKKASKKSSSKKSSSKKAGGYRAASKKGGSKKATPSKKGGAKKAPSKKGGSKKSKSVISKAVQTIRETASSIGGAVTSYLPGGGSTPRGGAVDTSGREKAESFGGGRAARRP